jgi:adenine-specific DNA-methyltransferase
MMEQAKLKELILKALKADERLWNEEKTELNQTLLLDLVEHIDEKVIGVLLQEKDLRDKFFVKITRTEQGRSQDVFVFKTNDFRFFMEENKVDNSYTAYKNRIGLTDGKRFLKDTNDFVLDFPYKDCVLEGGQSTEEGTDTYFELSPSLSPNKGEAEGRGIYEQKQGKRKEIFFNTVLAHDEIDRLFDAKALVNWKRCTKDGESPLIPLEKGEAKGRGIKRDEDGTIRENLIIKGNNLLALHSLKKQFAGKVKLIYIDPPYNTGNDGFKYNDNFNHSTWLTFMKNRLEVARELLRDDGVIFVSIDDDESHYLKVICDDIFKRENFIANVIWKKKYSPQNDAKYFSDMHDHILVFAKHKDRFEINLIPRTDEMNARYKNSDNDKRGVWKSGDFSVKTYSKNYDYPITLPSGRIVNPPKSRCWRTSKENFQKLVEDNRIWFGENGDAVPSIKRFLSEVKNGTPPQTIWDYSEVSHNQDARKEVVELFKEEEVDFGTPKPERLLQRIIHLGTQENDIVLDFFGGSGTTGAVAHKMNRQYILIEQMDYIHDLPEARLIKVIQGEQGGISKSVNWQGGGDFIYFELAKWNETAKEKILACESLEELESFFDEMYERYFLNYNLRIKEFREKVLQEADFRNLSLGEQKKIFIAMLDNNQMYVNKTEMADTKFGISEEDQRLTEAFYTSQK